MKNLWSIVLLLGLCACSEKAPQPKKPVFQPAAGLHRYSVTFAAVKIPDSTLMSLALPAYEECSTPDSRRKLAAHVLAHTADFSIRAPTGNSLPIVWNNGQTHVMVLPDSKQEAKDFETFGMMAKEFIAGVSVRAEDDKGEVYCDWFCNCGVHLKQPIGNSTAHGRGGICGSGMIAIGQPEIWPLCRGNGVSMWMLAALNRP